MIPAFIQIFPAVIYIGLMGYIARWKNILPEKAIQPLLNVVNMFLLPCLAFYSIAGYPEAISFKDIFFLPLFAIYAMIVGLFSGSLFLPFLDKSDPEHSKTFLHLAVANNFYLLPLPFIAHMYSHNGLGIYFLFVFGLLFGFWTIGIWILKNDVDLKAQIRFFLTPLFVTIAAGIGVKITGIFIPSFIIETTRLAGVAAIPLGIFITGAVMGNYSPRKSSAAVLLIAVRCICYPAFIIMSLTMLTAVIRIEPMTFNIIIICLLMPAPLISPHLCRKLKTGDPAFAEAAIFYTTLASIITIPVIYILFSR